MGRYKPVGTSYDQKRSERGRPLGFVVMIALGRVKATPPRDVGRFATQGLSVGKELEYK